MNRRIGSARKALMTGKYDEATQILEDLVREVQTAEVFRWLGLAYLGTGRLAEAEQSLLREVELRPGDPLAYVNLGAVYLQRNMEDDADRCFETAERLGRRKPREMALHFISRLPARVTDDQPEQEGENTTPAPVEEEHILLCRSCRTVERRRGALDDAALTCSKCGKQQESLLIPPGQEVILIPKRDGSIWTGESWQAVSDALIAGDLVGENAYTLVKPLADKNAPAQSAHWPRLSEVTQFPVMVLFRPIIARAFEAARTGSMLGAAVSVLVGGIVFLTTDMLPVNYWGDEPGFWARLLCLAVLLVSLAGIGKRQEQGSGLRLSGAGDRHIVGSGLSHGISR